MSDAAGSHSGGAETVQSAFGLWQFVRPVQWGILHLLDDQLRDPVALVQGLRLVSGVDEDDFHLVTVAGIDEARRVEHGDAAFRRQS